MDVRGKNYLNILNQNKIQKSIVNNLFYKNKINNNIRKSLNSIDDLSGIIQQNHITEKFIVSNQTSFIHNKLKIHKIKNRNEKEYEKENLFGKNYEVKNRSSISNKRKYNTKKQP